jgi:hypothetical protein
VKIHPRYDIVDRAKRRIRTALIDAIREDELTYIELLGILNEVTASWLKIALRDERHPDEPDKSADVE